MTLFVLNFPFQKKSFIFLRIGMFSAVYLTKNWVAFDLHIHSSDIVYRYFIQGGLHGQEYSRGKLGSS